jgi:hypothetical protein
MSNQETVATAAEAQHFAFSAHIQGHYVSEHIREYLKKLESQEDVEALAREIEKDSIRKHGLEENNLVFGHKLFVRRGELSSSQLESLLNFTKSFGLHLQIKNGYQGLIVTIYDSMF